MSDQPIDTNSSDQIIVTVEQADALLEMIASDENAGRISSAALSSGLGAPGLAGTNGFGRRRRANPRTGASSSHPTCDPRRVPQHARRRTRLEDLAHSTSLRHYAFRRGRRALQSG